MLHITMGREYIYVSLKLQYSRGTPIRILKFDANIRRE
jgi:hypothetical protein